MNFLITSNVTTAACRLSAFNGPFTKMSGENSPDENSMKQASKAVLDSGEHSLEVTGLGLITAVIIALAALVSDGTLPLARYLVFAAFLMVCAGGLAWRIFKLSPVRTAKSTEFRQPRI